MSLRPSRCQWSLSLKEHLGQTIQDLDVRCPNGNKYSTASRIKSDLNIAGLNLLVVHFDLELRKNSSHRAAQKSIQRPSRHLVRVFRNWSVSE